MASVVEIFAVYVAVFYSVPTGRSYTAYTASFCGGHQVFAYAGGGCGASAETVELAIFFIGLFSDFLFRKLWLITVYCHIGVVAVFRYAF